MLDMGTPVGKGACAPDDRLTRGRADKPLPALGILNDTHDLVPVLVQTRSVPADRHGRGREGEWRYHHRKPADSRLVNLDDVTVYPHLILRDHLGDVVDGADRDTGRVEEFDPVPGRP